MQRDAPKERVDVAGLGTAAVAREEGLQRGGLRQQVRAARREGPDAQLRHGFAWQDARYQPNNSGADRERPAALLSLERLAKRACTWHLLEGVAHDHRARYRAWQQ